MKDDVVNGYAMNEDEGACSLTKGGKEEKEAATPPGSSSTCVCVQLHWQLHTSLAQLT